MDSIFLVFGYYFLYVGRYELTDQRSAGAWIQFDFRLNEFE